MRRTARREIFTYGGRERNACCDSMQPIVAAAARNEDITAISRRGRRHNAHTLREVLSHDGSGCFFVTRYCVSFRRDTCVNTSCLHVVRDVYCRRRGG